MGDLYTYGVYISVRINENWFCCNMKGSRRAFFQFPPINNLNIDSIQTCSLTKGSHRDRGHNRFCQRYLPISSGTFGVCWPKSCRFSLGIRFGRGVLNVVYNLCIGEPYALKHSSSNALTIIVDTCEKNASDTLAYSGFAKAKLRSRVTSVETFASASQGRGEWQTWASP